MASQQYVDPYNSRSAGQYHYQSDSYDSNADLTRGGPLTGTTTALPHQTYDNMGPSYDPYSSANLTQNSPPDGNSLRNGQQQDLSRSKSQRVTYEDETGVDLVKQQSTLRRTGDSTRRKSETPTLTVAPVRKEWNGFDHGEFTPVTARPNRKSTRDLKDYRRDAQGNLWTKGSRAGCFGRFFCCTLMIVLLLVVSIALSLALWARPPSIGIGNVVTHNTTGSLSSPDGLEINLSVNISVNNPNYFSVDFKKLKVEIFYPINDVPVGGGESNNIIFKSGEETDFIFPFKLSYKSADDPGNQVFVDLGSKCGVGEGNTRSNISVKYKLSLAIRILMITISPVVENTFSFLCPQEIVNGANTVIKGTTTST